MTSRQPQGVAEVLLIAFQRQWEATVSAFFSREVPPFIVACFVLCFGPLFALGISELVKRRLKVSSDKKKAAAVREVEAKKKD